jgi:Carboxypeptidase regulatory-like domain/TonB dependent receptor
MRKLAHIAALLCVCLGISAVAQTQFSSITGRVSDTTGALISRAKVTLTNTGTNVRQETETNPDGSFIIANVRAGDYELSVENQGFVKNVQKIKIEVAQRLNLDILMQVGTVQAAAPDSEESAPLNTSTGEVSRFITEREIIQLPLITRNPYDLVGLTPGATNTGAVTGDTRGLGLAIAGQRTSSINFMLDGGANNDTFNATVGQTVPLDAVQEFRVLTNSTTAEFGRNPISVNLVTKSGTNSFHGSAYEFYRGAALSAAPFDDNANGFGKSNFVRNQFGGSVGGPVIKDKTFFFSAAEGLRIRSSSTRSFFVPTQDFLNAASANTRNFIQAFGGLPQANDPNNFITARQIVEGLEGRGPYETNPLRNAITGDPIPADTLLFQRANLLSSIDAGAGSPQNAWLFTGRIDHRFNDNTSLQGRYAFQNNDQFSGTLSLSPYQGFNTGQISRNQNVNLTVTHAFSPRLFTESRVVFNRFLNRQPLGDAPGTTPCWQYSNFNRLPTGSIVFPGYAPDACGVAALPAGGPQNVYQVYSGMTWSLGRHTVKAGGQYLHLRDNRTFGANQTAFFQTSTMQGMLNGGVDAISVAIDPNGKVPGAIYDTRVDGAFRSPNFTRHFRYNELAFFGEDSFKVRPGLSLTAGLRWEYFGVPHSPGDERLLDSNLVFPDVPGLNIFQQVTAATFQQTDRFYRPDYYNFAPRVGFAWDIFGNGRTVLRGGYGLFYDRNFGNAVFNVFQNPPSFAVLQLQAPPALPVMPNQFDTLSATGPALLLTGSARMLDNDLRTAYSAQYNATLERDIGKGFTGSISYLGANGYRLYSLNNLNQIGSCLLMQQIDPTFPCSPGAGDSSSRLNQTGLTNINRRGNEGLSRYHGMTAELRAQRLGVSGLSLSGAYTWSRSIDNSSSFFADSPFEGALGFFGFRDPYNPAFDRANSTNDIRQRFTLSGVWDLPLGKGLNGIRRRVFEGWSMSGILQAQTGGTFTVYDGDISSCNSSQANFCYPVIIGAIPDRTGAPDPFLPNTFNLYTGLQSAFSTLDDFCGGDPTCTARVANLQPQLLSPRNLFRTPGLWTFDLGLYKSVKLPREGMNLQFRSEFFNFFNHSNVFINPGTNVFTGADTSVTANKGVLPTGVKERRNIQLGLRLTF